MFFLSYIFLIFIQFSFAAGPCANVNLISEVNSPFNKIPVYDQDGSGTCFAYAASQLLEYDQMKSGGQSRKYHPAWLALNHAMKKNQSSLKAGTTGETIAALKNAPACDYDVVSNSLKKIVDKANITESEFISIVDKYAQNLQQRFGKLSKEERSKLTNDDLYLGLEDTMKQQSCSTEFQSMSAIYAALLPFRMMDASSIMAGILLIDCGTNYDRVSIPKVSETTFSSNLAYGEKISNVLTNNKSPLVFSHCGLFWGSPELTGIVNEVSRDIKEPDDKTCGAHESIIVGQRPVGQKCEYLVRNTWGNGWSKKNSNWKCFCRHKYTNEFVEECSEKTHPSKNYSVEGCWVDENIITRNTFKLYHVDKKR